MQGKELSPDQRNELLKILKARFEKNMTRHNGLEWANEEERLESNTENYGHSMKWKEPVVNQMLLFMMQGRANTLFTTVQ